MIKINKRVEYALMILKIFSSSKHKTKFSVRSMSDQLGLPFDSVSRIMQKLNKHQILRSDQGIQGGYWLEKPMDQLSFVELSEVVEGKAFQPMCEQGPCEHIETCIIKDPIQNLRYHVTQYFTQLSIAQLLRTPSDKGKKSLINITENNHKETENMIHE